MPQLSVRLFGPFDVSIGDETLAHFRTLKVQALLAYLVAGPPVAHPREALMALLWPDLSLESAQTNLRQIIYQLRKAIPRVDSRQGTPVPFLLSERQAVRIHPDALLDVDTSAFDTLLAEVRRHEHAATSQCHLCRRRLEQAAALYRAPFLADFYLDDSNEFETWAGGRRELYRVQASDALATLAEAHLRDGDYPAAERFARRRLELDDMDERAYRQLMEALARDGRRNEAVAIYETARRVLRDELGMSPSLPTTQLAERIAADDLVAVPSVAPLPPIRGYKLLDELGAGTLGRVYRAYQPVVGREVAVKVILPRYANRPDFIRRFEAEAQTVARLEHPHIVPLYDYWREPDNAYLVMRWLRGGSLAARLAGGPLSPDEAAATVDQIAAALSVAHRRGVVHRDVKAANILLDEDRNAYLSDFSLAQTITADGDPLAASSSPASVSPEQLLQEEVTPRADQYALAVVVYEMLTGRPPFPAGLPLETLRRRILAEPLPAAAERLPGLPVAVDNVLRRATARRPGDRYPDVESFARAFRRALNGTAASYQAAAVPANEQPQDAVDIPNPYKGLRAFEEADAAGFFGREALVRRLLDRLAEDESTAAGRFLAVVGPSGSGKSSLVKAGLLAALRRGAIPGSEGWFITEMTPGRSPLEELVVALRRVAVDPPADLLEPLRRDEQGLARVLRRVLPHDDGASPQLLLVIDQFEELFTLTEDEAARRHFIAALLAALREPDGRLRVVATLRADFYDRPLVVPGLGEILRDRTAVVLPMSRAELEAAIVRPAEEAGAALEPGLPAVMLADAADQPGSLPLLQYALTELFERRANAVMTLAAYEAVGGIAGALGRRADEIWESLDPAGQEGTRQMFLRLVTLGEGVEDTRRRVLRSELEGLSLGDKGTGEGEKGSRGDLPFSPSPLPPRSPAPLPDESLVTPLDAYGRARLLTFDRDPATRGPTVEVAHEALLREWPRLRGWLDASRADVRLQRLLAGETAEWLAAGRGDGYLLRGSRLDQFEEWLDAPKVSLTPDESAFLAASAAARNRRRAEEEARRQRELDTARQLAETERRRAEEQAGTNVRLRRRAALLAGALVLAGLLAAAAALFARSSDQNAAIAATRAAESNANAALAVENANLASTRQGEAVVEANQRATAEAEANVQRDTALSREREALESYSLSLAANARQALAANDQQLALLLALAANTVDNPPMDAWRTLLDVAYAPGAMRRMEVGGPVFSIDISPDGESMLTGGNDGIVRLWDTLSGELLREMSGHTDAVNVVAFSPDGRRALSGSHDRTTIIWDLASGVIIHQLEGHHYSVKAGEFLPSGRQVITGDNPDLLPGELILWDLNTGEITYRIGESLEEVFEGITDIAIAPDGQSALVGYRSDTAFDTHPAALLDIESGEVVHMMEGVTASINSVAITPDGQWGIGAANDTNLYVWELSTGRLTQTLRGHSGFAVSVAISPDGETAISGSLDGTIILWDMASGVPVDYFTDHTNVVWDVHFLDDRTAVSISEDGTSRFWDLAGNWRLERWQEPVIPDNHKVNALVTSPNGQFVLAATHDRDNGSDPTLLLLDYETGELVRRMENGGALVTDVAFTPDSRQAVAGLADGTLLVLDIESGQESYRLVGHIETITTVDVSGDGRLVASGSNDGEIMIWDLASRRMLHRLNGHIIHFPINAVRFLSGDRQLASSGGDGTIVLWDIETGMQISRLTGLQGDAGSHLIAEGLPVKSDTVAYDIDASPDGRLLSTGEDGTLLLWDITSGRSVREYNGHSQSVRSVDFSPDGRLALSGALNDHMILWNVATGDPIRRFPFRIDPSGGFYPLITISADGRTALTNDIDGSIVKWQLGEPSPAELLDWIASNRSLRELSCAERDTYRIDPPCSDGVAHDSVAVMLDTARRATASLQTGDVTPNENAIDMSLSLIPPTRVPIPAVLGENRGELVRGDYDIWTYSGEAGEVIGLHLIADRPLVDWNMPLDRRYEEGVLDTELQILAPGGRSWNLSKDETTRDLRRLSNARIIGFRLPEDGLYQIEARSALDDHAGPYTLVLERLPAIWHQDIFEEYTGHYLDGPWQWDVMIYIEDGRLFNTYPFNGGGADEWIALGESEFVVGGSSIVRMLRDENGAVVGYESLYGYEHAIGGHWYKGVRVDDLPSWFTEYLSEDVR